MLGKGVGAMLFQLIGGRIIDSIGMNGFYLFLFAGITIAFVTHEPDIAAFSSRTIVLKDGHIIKDFKNQKVQSAADELAKLPKEDYQL